jgi:hypothetical protein
MTMMKTRRTRELLITLLLAGAAVVSLEDTLCAAQGGVLNVSEEVS